MQGAAIVSPPCPYCGMERGCRRRKRARLRASVCALGRAGWSGHHCRRSGEKCADARGDSAKSLGVGERQGREKGPRGGLLPAHLSRPKDSIERARLGQRVDSELSLRLRIFWDI